MVDLSTYEGRQAYRDAHPGVIVDATSAYNPSTGQQVDFSSPSSGGGGGGGGGIAQTAPGLSGDNQAILDAFKSSSGFSLQQLAEQKRQFDANLEWTKQMWQNQGLPQLQIQQQAAQLAREEFENQKQMAAANLQLQQGTQGLDVLKTAASLGGPADYFQQANYLRGASANPNVPTFLNALQNNIGLAAFNAPGAASNAPRVQSLQGLASSLTGGAPAINQQSALSTIGAIGARGGAALAPQALEQLTPDEMGLFQSGLKASGFSMPSFLNSYQQSRIAQGAAQAA